MVKNKEYEVKLKNKKKVIDKKNVHKAIKQADYKIIEEYKDSFNKFLENRKSEIVSNIQSIIDVDNTKGIPTVLISEQIFKPLRQRNGIKPPEYNSHHFYSALEYVQDIVSLINTEQCNFVPNLSDVCKLLGISEKRFKEYMLHSPDEDTREACDMIITYVYGLNDHASKSNHIESRTHMFDSKASLGKKENEPTTVIANITDIKQGEIALEQYREYMKHKE